MKKTILLTLALLLATSASSPAADTIYVGPGYAYNNIQAAIDAAYDGDTVIVAPGKYTGDGNRDIDFLGKAITVRSTDPNDPNIVANTVVDCEYSGRGFIFQSGEDKNSILTGLTVAYGRPEAPPPPPPPWPGLPGPPCPPSPPPAGGGIYCSQSSPTITNCTISRNSAYWSGGGICCLGSNPIIINCTIERNYVITLESDDPSDGGGICCEYSSPTITNCTITGNSAHYGGGICCNSHSNLTITNCTISNNSAYYYHTTGVVLPGPGSGSREPYGAGGGICCGYGSNLTITNCTISNNSAGCAGGGIDCWYSSPTITNSIVWNNSPDEIYVCSGSSPVVAFSDVEGGWPGEGNIDADPLLTWDRHLQAESPCIDAGDPKYSSAPGETDIDGETRIVGAWIDMGPDEFLDSDSDALPDWWENKYFGGPTTANHADDPDGDEWANLAEYVYSTEPNVAPTNYYVNPEKGSDSFDGLSPEWDGQHRPKRTIQAGIDACKDRQNDIVTLTKATYTGYRNRNIYFYGKAITVRSTNPCDPCVVAATVIDCERRVCRGFNLCYNECPASVIKGLTITNGYAVEPYYPPYPPGPPGWDDGGGYIDSGIFIWKGGAIYCNMASPTISNCLIIANQAEEEGGGIYCYKGSPTITNCTISGNSAFYCGGGIYCSDSSPTISNCTISENSADTYGGGIYCREGSPKISNCIISENSVNYYGGGMCNNHHSNPTVTNCTFSENSARHGGGMYNRKGSNSTVTNCTFSGNSAGYGGGGGMSNYESNSTLTNCTFSGNSAGGYGGGICNRKGSNLTVTNCIVWANTAPSWPQICNVWLSSAAVTYSDIQGDWPGTGNIKSDPFFVNSSGGDYHLLPDSSCIDAGDNTAVPADTTDLDGDSNTIEPIPFDLDGNPRFVDQPEVPDTGNGTVPIVDMGAYEATALKAYLRIIPRVINRHTRSPRVMTILRFPEGITRDQIDRDEPLMLYPAGNEDGIEAIRQFVIQFGRRNNRRTAIFAFFDKAGLMEVAPDGRVELQLVGRFVDTGRYFFGSDTIWIKSRPSKP